MKKVLIIGGLFILLKIPIFAGVNPVVEELVSWTVEQHVGATLVYDKKDLSWSSGANWDIFKSKHDWLRVGLLVKGIGSNNVILAGQTSFNLGKLLEKIKGSPMVYLKFLEVGVWNSLPILNQDNTWGYFLNVIKIEF